MLSTLIILLAATAAPEVPVAPYLWAEVRDGKLLVDVTNDAGYPVEKLFETLGAKYKKKEAVFFEVLAEDQPAFIKGRKTLGAVSTDGALLLKPARVELSYGASALHAYVYTDTPSKAPALVAVDTPLAMTAVLRDAQAATYKETPPAGLATRIFAAMTKGLSAAGKKALAASHVGPAALHFVPGAFPLKARWLVWIDALIGDDPDAMHLDYAALVGDDGKVMDTIQAPEVTESWWRPLYVIDADGDGQDELIGQPYYYEGDSVVFYRWRAGKREAFTMTGDGA